jgi:hypothetical protein
MTARSLTFILEFGGSIADRLPKEPDMFRALLICESLI